MILNLEKINKFVNYKHFEMESINVINLIKPNVYMASIDLKDAFFSVPIHYDHQKYLKFIFGNLFQFTSMPNGYGPAMRIITKISKVPFWHLRRQGHNSVVYVDDSYVQGDTYQSCLANILDNIKLLRELGFVIHWKQYLRSTGGSITLTSHANILTTSQILTLSQWNNSI